MDKLKATTVAAGIIGLTVIPSFAGPAPMPSEPFPIDMPAACSGLRGSLGVTLGNTWLDGNSGTISAGEEDEFLSAMMELRLGMDLNDQWYGQLDLLGEVTDVGQSPDSYRDGWGGALHAMYQMDQYGLGVFAGWFQTDQDNDSTDSSKRILVGIEGLYEPSGLDLHWQIGGILGNGGNDDDGLDSLRDVYFGRVSASKSLGNGWRVGGDAVAAAGVMDSDRDHLRIYGLGAHIEKQFGTAWSLGLGYQGTYYDQRGEDDRIIEHFVGLNATWYFGAGGNNDDCRPKLDLPPVLRWMGITGGQLE